MIIHGQFYDGIVGKPDLDDALEHYGVLGMKWGVRKDPERAYAKARKKYDKYTKKIEKTNKKYLKEAGKVTRLIGRKKALKKVVRLNAKNDYLVNKQKKWDEKTTQIIRKEYDRRKNAAEKSLANDIKKAQKAGTRLQVSEKSNKLADKYVDYALKDFVKDRTNYVKVNTSKMVITKKGNTSDFTKEFKKKK